METTEGMRSAAPVEPGAAPGAAVGRPAAFARVVTDVPSGHRPRRPSSWHRAHPPASASQRAVPQVFSPNRAQEQEESK